MIKLVDILKESLEEYWKSKYYVDRETERNDYMEVDFFDRLNDMDTANFSQGVEKFCGDNGISYPKVKKDIKALVLSYIKDKVDYMVSSLKQKKLKNGGKVFILASKTILKCGGKNYFVGYKSYSKKTRNDEWDFQLYIPVKTNSKQPDGTDYGEMTSYVFTNRPNHFIVNTSKKEYGDEWTQGFFKSNEPLVFTLAEDGEISRVVTPTPEEEAKQALEIWIERNRELYNDFKELEEKEPTSVEELEAWAEANGATDQIKELKRLQELAGLLKE